MRYLPYLLAVFISLAPVQAFTVEQRTVPVSRATAFRLGLSSREEEIAKLEEQLRKLKEGNISEDTIENVKSMTDDDLRKYVADERVLEKIRGKDMLLSESDLIEAQILDNNDGGSSLGGSLTPVLAAVALAVFLFFFAQVPVGQEDLSRYSVTGTPTSKTIDLGDMNPNKPQN